VTSVVTRRMSAAAFLAAMFFGASVHTSGGQTMIPAPASLDVAVPTQPTPFRIGARQQLAYELHVTNYRQIDVTLTRIDVMSARDGAVLDSYERERLAAQLTRIGAPRDASNTDVLEPGMRVVAFFWLDLPARQPVPAALRHRISYRVGDQVATIETSLTPVRPEVPLVLAPPLRGGPWNVLYDPSNVRGHRRVLMAIDGKARIPARFAIDWVKTGEDGRAFHDDPTVLANHYGYGADVLAVADGVVATAVDRFPEPTSPITLDNEAGNHVALDLGDGRFAFYEHLQPGSVHVKVGQRVRRGGVLGRVGASGSVFSGPHLHFHVSDANSALGAEGLPFVIDQFDVVGGSRHQREMPAAHTAVRFVRDAAASRRPQPHDGLEAAPPSWEVTSHVQAQRQ
jgi:murein DD-endopeptidase MepM/ murein hydrolase activator NlpD